MKARQNIVSQILILSSVILISLMFYSTIFAETRKFEGKGDSPLETYDMRVARGLAIKRGVREALEAAVESQLNPKVFREKYDLLDKAILSSPEKFVTGTTVISEGKVEKKYRVSVSAEIDLTKLRAALTQVGLLLPPEKMPTWMVIIPEKVGEQPQRSTWINGQASIAESEFGDIIKRYGYRIVKPGEGRSLSSDIANTPEEHLSDLQAAAAQMGATHILLGESEFHSAGGVTRKEYTLGTARIHIKAIETATGNAVGEAAQNTSLELIGTNSMDKLVISAACHKLKDEVWGWLNKANPTGATGFNEVFLRFSGFLTYADYSAVVTALEENIPGVRKVTLRSMARGEAEIEVRYFGEAAELAKKLTDYKFSGFYLEKGGEEDGKIVLKVVPRPD